MNKKSQKALMCLALGASLAGTSTAYADLQFNGFGQVVVGSTLGNKLIGTDPLNNETYASFPIQSSYQADPSFQPESLFALQARAPLSDRLSATVQIVASGSNNNDFTPKFSWAYASYQISDEWALKGGRQRIPFYHYSDYLQVGESYPWIRTPLSVYGSPLVNYDGLSLTGSYELGSWYFQPQLIYGDFRGDLPYHNITAQGNLRNITGIVLDGTYNEWLELRACAFIFNNTSTIPQVNDPISGFTLQTVLVNNNPADLTSVVPVQEPTVASGSGLVPSIQFLSSTVIPGLVGAGLLPSAQGAALASNINTAADQINLNNDLTRVMSAGFEINRYNFLLNGEYIYTKTPGAFFVRARSYYASLGYHFGKLMPILLYGHSDDRASNPDTPSQIPSAVYSPLQIAGTYQVSPAAAAAMASFNANLAAAHAGAQAVLAPQRALNNFYEFGLRYDLTSNTALKLDYTYFRSGLDNVSNSRLLSAGFVFTF